MRKLNSKFTLASISFFGVFQFFRHFPQAFVLFVDLVIESLQLLCVAIKLREMKMLSLRQWDCHWVGLCILLIAQCKSRFMDINQPIANQLKTNLEKKDARWTLPNSQHTMSLAVIWERALRPDGPTARRTDGHTLLKSCDGASKKELNTSARIRTFNTCEERWRFWSSNLS